MPIAYSILFCHFLAAFSALGMPLFIPRMLDWLAPEAPQYSTGLLFVLPSVCTALAAPLWGRFADRYGKRTSLLRAQLGLAAGFLLSGFATTLPAFALGLVIQGLCGGTLAASNAYLATRQRGEQLAKSLNMTQLSARLALISGPIAIGSLMLWQNPLVIYRLLALLPLAAFALTLSLPKDATTGTPTTPSPRTEAGASLDPLLLLQFLFCFAMVVTFPYFLPFAESSGLSHQGLIGFLYSLPHLVYILLVIPIGRLRWSASVLTLLGMVMLAASCLGHYWLRGEPFALPLMRLLFGLGITAGYVGINRLLSARVNPGQAGRFFGRMDAMGKWAGVLAGIGAAVLVRGEQFHSPFLLGAAGACLGTLIIPSLRKSELFNDEPEPC
ncbi:MAG: MFS transporter [Gammaproteobacteria bacterium]|nr:MAG: MFS transporter [Gammaproteobacteria bacterium]